MKKSITIIALVFSVISGCELFDTRNPEDPKQPRSNYQLATTPELLFENLKKAFEEKFIDIYISIFVDTSYLDRTYRFIPSASAALQYSILSQWNLEAERTYFNRIISIPAAGVPVTLTLTNQSAEPGGDSARYQFNYSLLLPNNDESLPDEYRGVARFVIHVDNTNQWVITQWEDIEVPEYPSWSELKGRFY